MYTFPLLYRSFHVSFSLLLPHAPSLTSPMPNALSYQTLVLQSPGGKAPIPIPSLAHLESFLKEQLGDIKRTNIKKREKIVVESRDSGM